MNKINAYSSFRLQCQKCLKQFKSINGLTNLEEGLRGSMHPKNDSVLYQVEIRPSKLIIVREFLPKNKKLCETLLLKRFFACSSFMEQKASKVDFPYGQCNRTERANVLINI